MQPQDFGAGLRFVYFGVGFTLAAFLSMVLLTVLRPLFAGAPPAVLKGAMLTPVFLGTLLGLRVSHIGARDNLPLSAAIKRSLLP